MKGNSFARLRATSGAAGASSKRPTLLREPPLLDGDDSQAEAISPKQLGNTHHNHRNQTQDAAGSSTRSVLNSSGNFFGGDGASKSAQSFKAAGYQNELQTSGSAAPNSRLHSTSINSRDTPNVIDCKWQPQQTIKKTALQQDENYRQQTEMADSGNGKLRKAGQQASRRRKNELGSFLAVLFGTIMLLLVALQQHTIDCAQQFDNNNSAGKQPRLAGGTTSTQVPPPTKALNSSQNMTTPPTAALSITPTPQPSGGEADEDTGDGSDNSDANVEEPLSRTVNETGAGGSELGELIVDTASGGVDVLVGNMRKQPPAEDEDRSSSSGGGGHGDDDEADGEDLEAPPPGNDRLARGETGETGDSSRGGNALASALVNATNTAEHSQAAELRLAFETYARWKATGDDIIELFSRKLLPKIVEHGYDVDAVTVTGLLQVFNGIRALKPWALKLLDASAKISPGLLLGTQSDFGDFDECLNIRVDDPTGLGQSLGVPELDPETGLASTTLVGKYCLADVEFPKPPRKLRQPSDPTLLESGELRQFAPIELRRPLLNFSETAAFKDTIFVETGNFFHMLYVDPIRVGVCLTNKIDSENFARVFNKLVEDFRVTINFRGRCVTKFDKQKWTAYQLVSAYVLVGAISLVCLSTLLDVLHLKINKLPLLGRWNVERMQFRSAAYKYRPLFTSFSIIRNTRRLFKAHELPPNTRADAATKLRLQQRQQYNLNLVRSVQEANSAPLAAKSGGCSTTTSSIPDSSVESSPSIERRSSSFADGTSAAHLIVHSSSSSTSDNHSKSGSCSLSGASPKRPNKSYRDQPAGNSISTTNSLCESSSASGGEAGHLVAEFAALSDAAASAPARVDLLSLHGIRVITMTWMIVNHTYMFGGFFVLWAHRRLIDIAEWPKSLSFQLVLNGWLTVETYFFLSAMIVVLNVMPLLKARKFGYATYVLHRLVRLIPAYVGLVCLNFLWPLVSSGPVWLVKGESFVKSPCENYLWTNFLFINNWIWPEKQCMVHTWFLSADFQLYLLVPVIVYLIYRRPALGHSLNLIVAVAASVFSGFVIYANKLLPTTLINKLEFDAIKQQLSYSYFATYQHVGPYCLGILTGYLLHKRSHIKLPKYLTWMLWVLLPPLSFTTLLLTYLWNGAYEESSLINPSPLVSALYVAIHRTIWTSLVAWIVFACATGRAKLLSDFLSHSIFIPLSRLSFSIYLVHLPIILFRALNLRHTVDWTDSNILWEACGNFVFSVIMGYFLNIAFESPIINLEKVMFGRGRRKSELLSSKAANSSIGGSVEDNLCQQLAHSNNQIGAKLSQATPAGFGAEKAQQQQTAELRSRTQSASTVSKSSDASDDGKLSSWANSNASKDGGLNEPNGHNIFSENLEFSSQKKSDGFSRELEGDMLASTKIDDQASNELQTLNQQLQGPSPGLLNEARLERSRRPSLMDRVGQRAAAVGYDKHQSGGGGFENKDVYNINDEYQHYAPGNYQQWRMLNSTRPVQYATLARTDRPGNQNLPYQQQREEFLCHKRPSNYHQSFANFRQQVARSSINNNAEQGAMMPNRGNELEAVPKQSMYQQPFLDRQRARHMLQRRQGRYNTLTGAGTRDWRSAYAPDGTEIDIVSNNWQQLNQTLLESNTGQNWHRPGVMIPRIDSSTLRRQTTRRPETANGSIVEEQADEENSAL